MTDVGASGNLEAMRIRQVLVVNPDRPLAGLAVEPSWSCHGFQSPLLDRNPPDGTRAVQVTTDPLIQLPA